LTLFYNHGQAYQLAAIVPKAPEADASSISLNHIITLSAPIAAWEEPGNGPSPATAAGPPPAAAAAATTADSQLVPRLPSWVLYLLLSIKTAPRMSARPSTKS
jgi:hypothetical protein